MKHTLALSLLLPSALALDPLKSYFKGGQYLGFFTNQARMTSAGSSYVSIAETNFNGATESNACKWEVIEPNQNSFSWSACDYTFNWITSRGGKFRGHTLVWHSQLAGWVTSLSGATLDAAMKNHITTIMKRYAGKTYCWDVVNEALNEDGSLRSSVFSQQLGSDYIAKAMGYARAADPNAKLYYNDYNLEAAGAKQNGAYNLISNLKSRGLVDGIGFQGHLNVGQMPANLKGTIQRFASLGVEVAFTEVDIGTKSQDFTQQAKDYATLTDACVNVQGCVGITIGGIRDNESSSWRNTEYCLLWDVNYKPKPDATSLASVAAAGTARPTGGSNTTPGTTPTTKPTTTPATTKPTTTPTSTGCQSPKYGQCGGQGWTGCVSCVSGSTCTYSNAYYSQCL